MNPLDFINKALGTDAGRTDESGFLYDQIRKKYGDLPLPVLKELALKGPEYAGDVLAPRIAAPEKVNYTDVGTVQQGDTEMKNVSTDPRLAQAQMAALAQMQGIAADGGMNLRDKANLSKIQGETSQADRGRREAILQNMQARGMGGSGAELLAQLQSSQAATDRSAQQGLDVAAMAQERALQAMMQSGQMGGDIRAQSFGEQAKVASAQDAINNFNTSNTNQGNQFNASNTLKTGMFNSDATTGVNKAQAGIDLDAKTGNVNRQQGVNNATTDAENTSRKYNAGLPQQNFDNEVKKIDGESGIMKVQATRSAERDDLDEKERSIRQDKVIDGASKAAVAASDKRAKKNIKPLQEKEISDFLSSLKPAKFEYKDKADGEGERPGVMAQDVEKSDLGKTLVVEDNKGKKYLDNNKMMGAMLAALKHLSDKVG